MNSERKLASIRRILKVEPIPGADAIEKLTIDGWELVSQKGNFKEGDLCVYFEVDSFLPVREEFEFLRSRCFKSTKNLGDGFRLKTIKLRGQISQGLALPMKEFFQYDPVANGEDDGWYYVVETPGELANTVYLTEGSDVTEYLKVQKYEKPIPTNMAGKISNWPSFFRKTDQERIQNCFGGVKNWIYYSNKVEFMTERGPEENTETLYYVQNEGGWVRCEKVLLDPATIAEREVFEATLKLDGSSMTIWHNDQQYGVCSRNYDVKRDSDNLFWKVAINSGLIGFLTNLGRNLAIQGELMGPGVQGNRERFDDHRFYIFDIFDIDNKQYMTPTERDEFIETYDLVRDFFEVYHVPIIEQRCCPFANEATVKDILARAEIPSINHETAEGIVFKSHVPGGPSFKAISQTFLLTESE